MGGFQIPPMPPQLVEALKRSSMANAMPGGAIAPGTAPLNTRPGPTLPSGQAPGPLPMNPPATPIRMGPGGVNLNPQAPGVNAMGVPSAPMPTQTPSVLNPKESTVRTQSGASVPAPTDDPAVVGTGSTGAMGAMPKTPDLGSYLNPALRQYQSDLSGYQQADTASRIDPNAVKPHLWERLLGGVVGGISGNADVGKMITHRRLNEAEKSRDLQLAPWTQRLQMDKEGVPLAESAARTAYQQGELGLRTATENRERYSAITNSEYKDALASIRDEVAKGNHEKAEDLLDQKQKELEQKKDHDAEWFQMQHALLDLREKIADKGKDHTSQTMAAETTKQNAVTAAEDKYRKARRQLDLDYQPGSEEYTRALAGIEDEHTTDLQRAEDTYEAKGTELGGNMPHQDVSSWRSKSTDNSTAPAGNAKPAAAPAENSAPNGTPTATGPKGETPVRKAHDGKVKIGFYKSTGQWMVVPQTQVPTLGGK